MLPVNGGRFNRSRFALLDSRVSVTRNCTFYISPTSDSTIGDICYATSLFNAVCEALHKSTQLLCTGQVAEEAPRLVYVSSLPCPCSVIPTAPSARSVRVWELPSEANASRQRQANRLGKGGGKGGNRHRSSPRRWGLDVEEKELDQALDHESTKPFSRRRVRLQT